MEVYAFMGINALTMIYAAFQVYQFRGFGTKCDAITLVGYLALANVREETDFYFQEHIQSIV